MQEKENVLTEPKGRVRISYIIFTGSVQNEIILLRVSKWRQKSLELSTVFLSVGTYVTTACTPVRQVLGLAIKNVR